MNIISLIFLIIVSPLLGKYNFLNIFSPLFISFFFSKFLLLFNYSCMPFLPSLHPTPCSSLSCLFYFLGKFSPLSCKLSWIFHCCPTAFNLQKVFTIFDFPFYAFLFMNAISLWKYFIQHFHTFFLHASHTFCFLSSFFPICFHF